MPAMATIGYGAIRAGQEVDSADLRTASDTIRPLIICALSDGSHEFVSQEWEGIAKASDSRTRPAGAGNPVIHSDDLTRINPGVKRS